MLKIIYNQYKGYCVPRGGDVETKGYRGEKILTNGFDSFNWEDDELQQYSKPKQFYEEEEKEQVNESIYDDESKTHLNHEMKELIHHPNDEISKKVIPKKKHEGKRRKKQRKSDIDDFHIPSDVNKVKVLNHLYSQINSTVNLKNMNDDDRLLQFFDITVYKEDLDNLKDDEWLNDNNISFIYEYLERYQLNHFDKIVSNSITLLRPSMVYLLANHPSDPKELKGVLPPIEKSKFVFLPVNDNDDVEDACAGSHWSLVIISLLDRTALIYDTLERANETEAKQVISKISQYLDMKFQIKIIEKTPQQINGSDCGIMVGQITSFLLSRLLNLKYLEENFIDLDLQQVEISAIDGRIFLMGTLLNLVKHKRSQSPA